jgi:hypothetical protein
MPHIVDFSSIIDEVHVNTLENNLGLAHVLKTWLELLFFRIHDVLLVAFNKTPQMVVDPFGLVVFCFFRTNSHVKNSGNRCRYFKKRRISLCESHNFDS